MVMGFSESSFDYPPTNERRCAFQLRIKYTVKRPNSAPIPGYRGRLSQIDFRDIRNSRPDPAGGAFVDTDTIGLIVLIIAAVTGLGLIATFAVAVSISAKVNKLGSSIDH